MAYWPEIYSASGYPELIAAKAAQAASEAGVPLPSLDAALRSPIGELAGVSYQLAPRAQIFRRGECAGIGGFLSAGECRGPRRDCVWPRGR